MAVSIMQGAILRALLALATTVRGLKVCLLRGLRIGFPICFVTALQVSLGTLPRNRVGHLLGKFEAFAELNELSSGALTGCLLYTSPSPRDLSTSRMPSSA